MDIGDALEHKSLEKVIGPINVIELYGDHGRSFAVNREPTRIILGVLHICGRQKTVAANPPAVKQIAGGWRPTLNAQPDKHETIPQRPDGAGSPRVRLCQFFVGVGIIRIDNEGAEVRLSSTTHGDDAVRIR